MTAARALFVVVVPAGVGYGPKQYLAFSTLERARKEAGTYPAGTRVWSYERGEEDAR